MATFAGFECMNGATLSRIEDGAGVVWRGCCMQRTGNKASFGFYITKDGIEVPYAPFCKDRGQVTKDGHWTAWNGAQYYEGPLPGFTPLPTGAPVAIPASGAIAALYTGVYVAADFDTAAETALRVQKQIDAIQELVDLLKRAGVLV